ncbi:unnamed protein product [Linum trigynum]
MPISPPSKSNAPASPLLEDKEMMKAVVPYGSIIPAATMAIPQLGKQPLDVEFSLVSRRGNYINSDPDRQLDDNFGDQQGTDFYTTHQRKLPSQDFSDDCDTGRAGLGQFGVHMSRLVMGQIPLSNLHNQG